MNNYLSRLKKDSIVYAIAIIIPALLGIVSLPLYTRIFSTQQFGQYNLVLTTTLLITTLFSQWIQQSIQRYRPTYKKNDNLPMFNANLTVLLISMLFFITILGIVLEHFKSLLGIYSTYYNASILLIITQFLFLTLSAQLQSDFKVKQYKNFNLWNAILKISLAISLIYFFKNHPISILYGLVISQLLLLTPMLKETKILRGDFKSLNFSVFFSFLKQFFFYGFPMIGWFLGNTVLNLSDRYMLAFLGSSRDVGIYSANYSIVSAGLGLLTTPLLSAAHPIIMNMPYTEKSEKREIENTISFFSNLYMMLSVPLVFFVTAFHREIAIFLLGEEFRSGSTIIPILFIGTLFWNLAMFGHKGYEITEKTRTMLLFVFIAAVVNIILNLLLIPSSGYRGASLATMVSMMLYPLLIFIFSKKGIKWKINYSSACKIIGCSIASILFITLLKSYLVINIIFLRIAINGIVYVALYLYLLIITKELETKKIKMFLKK